MSRLEKMDDVIGYIATQRVFALGESNFTANALRDFVQERENLFDKIKASLPKDLHKTLNDYADSLTDEQSLAEELYYEQGLKDGIKMMKKLLYED